MRREMICGKHIVYSGGYKFQLRQTYELFVIARPAERINLEFISLTVNGLLTIKRGYAWDGASGPGIDTKTIMRGSLVHDALYQLMREGGLAQTWRKAADKELRRICLEDGMWKVRAWWVYRAVRRCARKAALPKSVKPLLTAP